MAFYSGVKTFVLLEELASDSVLGLFLWVVDYSFELARRSGGILFFH